MHPHVPSELRFYLIPNDTLSNNINLLVEQSSIEGIFTPDEYGEELKREKQEKKNRRSAEHAESNGEGQPVVEEPPLGQEESMGDFYFETHNYPSALEQYAMARSKHIQSIRLKRKVVVTTVNIGIQFIKSREYPKALEYMERALELEPKNPHAYKKAKQLRKTIDKTERRMREYYEEQEKRKEVQ